MSISNNNKIIFCIFKKYYKKIIGKFIKKYKKSYINAIFKIIKYGFC